MYYFGKFKYWCQKVLPLVYDDSLSYYEVLCKLMKHISDMLSELEKMGKDITNLQALYVELKNYVDHYFDSADFSALVDAKLDEMVEDGTFDELVSQTVLDYLANYVDDQISNSVGLPRDFVTHRVFRIAFTEDDSALQSIAYDGTNYYFGGNILSLVTDQSYDVGGRIVKINATTGAVVGEKYYSSPNSIGHCNSMAYLDGTLYVSDGHGNLVLVDASDLSVIRTVTQNSYHNLVGVSTGGENNEHIIVEAYTSAMPYRIRIAEFDPTDDSFTELCYADRVHETNVSPTRQGFVCNGNMAYPLFNDGNAIYAINILNGDVETIINPGLGDEWYPYGEIEDGVTIDGQVYLYSALMQGTSSTVNFFGQVFRTNLGGLCYSEYPSGNRVNRHRILYVDPTSTAINPDGSAEYPFKSIEEASCVLGYLCTQAPNEFYQLTVQNGAGLSGEALTLMNARGMIVDGGGCSLSNVTAYNGNYEFENITITDTLYATNSDVVLKNCTVAYINTSYCDVKAYNCTIAKYRMNSSMLNVFSPADGGSWKSADSIFDAYGRPNVIPIDTTQITADSLRWDWGDFVANYLTTHTHRSPIKINATMKFDNGLGQQPVVIVITSADWNTIVAENTANRYLEMTGYYDGALISLTLQCAVDIDGITFSVSRCVDSSATAVDAPPFQLDNFSFQF